MAHSDANLEVLPSPNFEGDDRYVYGYTLRRPDAFDQEETARQMLKMLGLPILKTKQLGLHDFHSTVFYIAAWSPVHQEVLSVWTADNRIPGPEDRETIQEQLGDEWEGPRWIKADEPFSCAKVDLLFHARINRKEHRPVPLEEAVKMYRPPLSFVGAQDSEFFKMLCK